MSLRTYVGTGAFELLTNERRGEFSRTGLAGSRAPLHRFALLSPLKGGLLRHGNARAIEAEGRTFQGS